MAVVGTQPEPSPVGISIGQLVCVATAAALPAASTAGRSTSLMRGTIATSTRRKKPTTSSERSMLDIEPIE